MNLVKYIILLLDEAGQVTLPSFGKFELKLVSVKKDEETNQILPPSYSLNFNQQHNLNDDNLANLIADLESIDVEKAKESVYQIISEWKNSLKTNQNLTVENLGTFTSVKEKINFQNVYSFATYKNFGLPTL